ncbi:hypothetical protein C8R46DRAFT_1224408 [Mycena filopes]|nr:hypothetical protein C8R46DRAFT_1224408 [Mycena filopes]
MQEDFALNNDNPDNVSTGRGLRHQQATLASTQYREQRVRSTASLTRRRARQDDNSVHGPPLDQNTAPASQSTAPPPYPSQDPFPAFPRHLEDDLPTRLADAFPQNNPDYVFSQNNQMLAFPQSSPNPLYSGHQVHPNYDWDSVMARQTLHSMPGGDGYSPYDDDENYAGQWPLNSFSDSTGMINTSSTTGGLAATPALPLPSLPVTPQAPTVPAASVSTPQNLRVFPQANASISSTPVVALVPRKRKVGAVIDSDLVLVASSPTEPSAISRRPLVRRVDRFGPGLHDNRQRPFKPSSTIAGGTQDKENEGMDDVSDTDSSPLPKKKSRKEKGSRSIGSIRDVDPVRAGIVEAGYDFVQIKVITDEKFLYLEGRTAIALLAQEAFDYGAEKLGLDPEQFNPVTEKEQDLFRQQVYDVRKSFKHAARDVAQGPDGFGFIRRSRNDSAEVLETTATKNRDLVAILTHKSALVYSDPSDRTIKGSMYKHPAIQAMAELTVFKNLLSHAIQYPRSFDDAPLPVDGDEVSAHKPRFNAVTLLVMILALRGAVNEWSSGHWIPEDFTRKLYYKQFLEDLKIFRSWQKYTASPTVLIGHGPTRTIPPSFLARTLQESITEKARFKLFKNVVVPVPSTEVLDDNDFALNQ